MVAVECENDLYGCLQCTVETANSIDFPVCTKCQDGLMLLRNQTFSTQYYSTYSFCVPDCREAHSSYVNTQSGVCDCKRLLSFIKGPASTAPPPTPSRAVRFARATHPRPPMAPTGLLRRSPASKS